MKNQVYIILESLTKVNQKTRKKKIQKKRKKKIMVING